MRAISVTDGAAPEPCVQFLAPIPGQLLVGVNESDLSNDHGGFLFTVSVAPPPDDIERRAYGSPKATQAR